MPHFIHSLVDRLVPLWTTMNNAAISITIQKCFFLNGHVFISQYIPSNKLLVHMVTLSLTF